MSSDPPHPPGKQTAIRADSPPLEVELSLRLRRSIGKRKPGAKAELAPFLANAGLRAFKASSSLLQSLAGWRAHLLSRTAEISKLRQLSSPLGTT
jgi:hypothetical protein